MQSPGNRNRAVLLWILGIATLVVFALLFVLDKRMTDAGGPGIIRFELVADRATAARILLSWGDAGQDAAKQSLWLDYAYLVLYAAFLATAVKAVGDALSRNGHVEFAWMASWGWKLAIVSAVFDALEDAALLAILGGNDGRLMPMAATWFAVLKFAALLFVLALLVAALVTLWKDRRKRKPSRPKRLQD